jgi:hypothetical protein
MNFVVKQPPTSKMFLANMEEKILDTEFTGDIYSLLRPGVNYENDIAYELIKSNLLEKI